MEETNPTVIALAIAAGLILWMAMVVRFRFILWVLGAMVFASAIAATRTKAGTLHGSWMLPVLSLRSELFLGAGILILLGSLLHLGSFSLRRTSGQAWMLLILAWYRGAMSIFHEESGYSGFETIGGAALTILPVLLVIPALLQTRRDWYSMLRMVLWVDCLWIACSLVQFAVDPSRMIVGWDNRFVGVGGNPQHAGVFLAVATCLALSMMLNDPERRYRLLWTGVFAINLLMLAATGSRTGAGMLTLGAAAVLYRRWGRLALALPVGAIALWIVYEIIIWSGMTLGFEHLTSLENTRSGPWETLYQEGMENPVFGTGLGDLNRSENSYLWGFAAFGAGFLFLLVVFFMMSVVHCFKLLNASRHLPKWRPIIDLVIGYNMMYFAGAVFEGYIVLRATAMLTTMLIIGSLSAVLLHAYRTGEMDLLEDEFDQRAASEEAYEDFAADEGWEYDPTYAEP